MMWLTTPTALLMYFSNPRLQLLPTKFWYCSFSTIYYLQTWWIIPSFPNPWPWSCNPCIVCQHHGSNIGVFICKIKCKIGPIFFWLYSNSRDIIENFFWNLIFLFWKTCLKKTCIFANECTRKKKLLLTEQQYFF